MDQITGNLPALITVLLVAALLFFVGARLGVGFLIRRLAGALVVLVAVSVVTFLLGVLQEPYAVVYTQVRGQMHAADCPPARPLLSPGRALVSAVRRVCHRPHPLRLWLQLAQSRTVGLGHPGQRRPDLH